MVITFTPILRDTEIEEPTVTNWPFTINEEAESRTEGVILIDVVPYCTPAV